MILRRNRRVIAAYAASATMLLWVMLANGFPAVFADTGAYLRAGLEVRVPRDRPPTYGLAIMPFFRLFGLWSIPIAQALFTTWVIDRTLLVITRGHRPIMLFGASALLAMFTSLPWLVAQILPDLFTVLDVLLGFILIFDSDRLASWERWALPPLLGILVAFHLTFIPVLGGAAVAGGLLAWRMKRSVRPLMRSGIVLASVLTATLMLSLLNLRAHEQFKPSAANSAFMLHRFLNGRIAQPVIVELCAKGRVRQLCRLPYVLDINFAEPGMTYLWSDYAPLSRAEIRQLPAEEAMVIERTMAEHPLQVVHMALRGFGEQILLAGAGDGMVPYTPEHMTYRQILTNFPQESPAFLASRQQQGTLRELLLVPDRAIGLSASFFVIVILVVAVRRGEAALAGLAVMTVATLLINAFVCSFLSGVFERFQARVLWMPFFTIIAAGAWRLGRLQRATERKAT